MSPGAAAAGLILRLCFAGPLLYIGLTMFLDPRGFAAGLATLSSVLRTFELRFRAASWRHRSLPLRPSPTVVTPATKWALRIVGLTLIAAALLHLSGAVA